ncbi:TRAP transporter permease [Desulfovirgula thermocuniculi]|uniref:TRAP transporter permease n=1 Tax=Desulfovirgula thermocuniculi TaxID=348842 RepID=UPI001B7FEDFF|nr:TRAP transporter permease [Desulfovirgula thermocuniculi]
MSIICIIWSLFQLYTAAFGVFPPTLQRAPHLGFALVLIYLLYPFKRGARRDHIPLYDFLLAALSAAVTSYHVVFYRALIDRAGAYTPLDIAVSALGVLLVLEATRRVAGPVLVSLAALFLLYGYFGPYMPGFLAHRGYSFSRIVTHSFLSTEGILGVPISVSSTFIFLFLVFAAYLRKTGIGDWLTKLAIGIAGGATGGPAKAAVIASACQGTVSGSSVANVVGTGSVTIPLMKHIGYRKEFAGAVEAAASTGGQLMPPIMGAAAFIMTEFTGVSYAKIAAAAAIPAILYFTGVFTMVHLEAKKAGLKGLPREELPSAGKLLKEKWYLLTPIAGIVFFLVTGRTAMLAALYGIILTVAVSFISRDTRMSLRGILQGLEEGARSALGVAAACATAGILVGIITLTGLGLKMAHGIVELSGGNIYLTMLFTMIASLILGMGVPTTANYIIQATIAAPALVAAGVKVLAAHLFVFYFGIIADVTPPVALAAFAASGIAGSEPFRTGFEASKLAFAAYLVPYIFALSPSLVLIDVTPLEIIKALVTSIIGMIGVGAAIAGYLVRRCSYWERAVLFAGGVMLVDPGTLTDAIGIVVVSLVFLWQKVRAAKDALAGKA